MKILGAIVGILLGLFGLVITAGILISIAEGTSGYSPDADIVGLLLLGVVPLVGGVALFLYSFRSGTKTKNELRNCIRCNRPLTPEWVTCPYCGEQVPTDV